MPYETNNSPVSEPILQGEGVGSGAIDVVNIFDDGNTAGATGYLTDIPANPPNNPSGNYEFGTPITTGDPDFFSGQGINISGLDLPGTNTHYDSHGNVITGGDISHTSSSTGINTTYEAGIDIVNVDAVQILLGTGNDTFTIDTTTPTTNADDGLQTMMVVEGGGGSNTINVTASSDPLVLYGNESASGIEYNSTERSNGIADGNGVVFTNFGSDTIDASGATGTVVIVGGPNNDTLTGGSGTNWIAGGEGDDTISASGALNYIFGDSSFTVGETVSVTFDGATSTALDLASRLLTIDNDLLLMDAGVNGGVQSAGSDTITVTGSGESYVFGDYGIIDIASQSSPGVVGSVQQPEPADHHRNCVRQYGAGRQRHHQCQQRQQQRRRHRRRRRRPDHPRFGRSECRPRRQRRDRLHQQRPGPQRSVDAGQLRQRRRCRHHHADRRRQLVGPGL